MGELAVRRQVPAGGGIAQFVHGAAASGETSQNYRVRFPADWTWAYLVFVYSPGGNATKSFLGRVEIPAKSGKWASVEFIRKDPEFTSFSILDRGSQSNPAFRTFEFGCNLCSGYISWDSYSFQL